MGLSAIFVAAPERSTGSGNTQKASAPKRQPPAAFAGSTKTSLEDQVMPKMSKRSSAVIAAAVAVGAVAAGTVAYAAFQRTQAAEAGSQGAEKSQGAENFAPLTVTATWIGVRPSHIGAAVSTKLLPEDTADVRIAVINPGANTVNGKVVSIVPIALTDEDITGVSNDDRNYCRGNLVLKTFNPENFVVGRGGDGHTVDLRDAVELNAATDIRCSNMSFPLNYQVTFAATRGAVNKPAFLTPAA
jgi:hypothetical protein